MDCFFTELAKERSEAIEAVSMDLGPAFDKSARKPGHATNAIICYDPFYADLRIMPTCTWTSLQGKGFGLGMSA